MIGDLPHILTVSGKEYEIRTDYRNILRLSEAIHDPDLFDDDKNHIAVYLLFKDFPDLESTYDKNFNMDEAVEQILWFISAGNVDEDKESKPTYDWVQDEQYIFSAINKVAGREVRESEYLHWWTFLGYFNEIDEGVFRFISDIRYKINNHQKLEKHELEFYRKNRKLVDIKPRLTAEEQAAEDYRTALLNEVLG